MTLREHFNSDIYIVVNPGYLDESIGRDGSHPFVVDMGHRIPMERRHSADEAATGSSHSWARYGSGRDAAELISELPSRQLGTKFLV